MALTICCLGDIHYFGGRRWLEGYVDEHVVPECDDIDALIIVGDVTGDGDLRLLHEFLEVLRDTVATPYILVVPGNHDIYVKSEEEALGVNSLLKLQLFNDVVEKTGCIALMKNPFILSKTGFVGNIGWYDYSYAPDYLGLRVDDFREKVFGTHIWVDREYVKLPFDDVEFTYILLEKLENDIKKIYDEVEEMIVALHHIPFREMVIYKLRPEWDYFSAFMGSEAFGYMIKKYRDKVKLVVHGHSHDGVETRICKDIDGIKTCNCASPIPLVIEV